MDGIESIEVRDEPVDIKQLEGKIDELKEGLAKMQSDIKTIKTDVTEIKER